MFIKGDFMTEKIKLRSEIDDKYKWDLTTIYQNEEKWQKDYEKAQSLLEKVPLYRKEFLQSADNLLAFLKFDEKVDRLISKLYYYAHLNHDANTLEEKYKKMYDKIKNLNIRYNKLTTFFVPAIMKLDQKKLNDFYKENDELLEYKFMFEQITRHKKHNLSEEKEKMIKEFSKVLNNPSETYNSVIYSDIKFDNIKDEKGKEIEFNDNVYRTYIVSKNREVRKAAFNSLYDGYKSYKNIITNLFIGNMESNIVISKLKKYKSAIEKALFQDNIDISVYNNLIKTVNDNLDVIYKYFRLKKEVLKLDEFHLYDIYAELIEDYDKKYSFEEAKDLTLKSLSILGENYISNIEKAFDEKWIDIYYNKGKYTGAYSSGFYDTNPFILLNYKGKLDDVSTLVHELGHSMHTLYSCKNNKYVYSNYRIFVAEVASTVNELLLANYLLKNSKLKKEKLFVLNHIMDMFKSTLYRQTMFSEFEYDMYKKQENECNLTSESISDDYYNLVKKYHGNDVIVDEKIRYEWMRIPHFYYNFYVYKYVTGLCAACYIVDGILNNKENALENYLKFLKTGGSNYPLEELKVAGVDMTDSKVIERTIKMFDSYIDKFKELYNS